MKRVLLVTDVDFWEKCSGHRMRISALIEYLARYVDLTVVKAGPVSADIEEDLQIRFKTTIFFLEKKKFLDSNGYGRKLKGFLKDQKFDTVIIEYIHCSYFLNFMTGDMQVILDAHDIISDRNDEFKKYGYPGDRTVSLYNISKETETEIFKIYDHVIALCAEDLQKINALTGQNKALLCPHPEIVHTHPVRQKVKVIAYIASSYLPNIDAITFFVANCWPQISARYPVQLNIYGTICEALTAIPLHGISLMGFVPFDDEIYECADIIINPVRFGAGLKIKNVEALAHGLPLVTTTHGARGLEKGIDNSFLVADEPTDIVRSVITLIENAALRTELSQSARLFIKNNFSAERCFEPLLKAINS